MAVVACVLAPVAMLATACDPDEDDAVTGCETLVREASQAIEVDEQVRGLDRALVACSSRAAFIAELDRYPSIIGYDSATFVALRCERTDDDAVRSGPTCSSVIVETTVPASTLAPVVFVGATLDGRQIELRPEDGVEFAGDVPAVVQQTVDIAVESGCEGVAEQRNLWASRIDDPDSGDIASVYAQHAQNVADYIGCDLPPLGGDDA
jgi:hypothetical protein